MSKEWTDKLPQLLEDYTEAAPEGLWDAVLSEVQPRRRRVAAWWYAAGAGLAAAAAVVLAVFLWKTPSSAPVAVLPVPEDRLAQEVPAAPENPAPETPSAGQIPFEAGDRIHPKRSTSPASIEVVPPQEPKLSQTPPEALPPQPEIEAQSPVEALPPQKETEAQPQEEAPSEAAATEPVREQWPQEKEPVKKLRKRKKLQLGVTSGSYLAQAGTIVTKGYGVPTHPGMAVATKATQESGVSVPMLSRNRESTTEASHRQSIRLGVGVDYSFTPRWSVGSGLMYTVLRSDFQTHSGETEARTTRHLYYLGIPLSLQWKALKWKRLSISLNAGPMWETAIGARENTRSYIGGSKWSEQEESPSVRDTQWSLHGGIGVQYQLARHGAIFLQPGLSWYFSGSGAVESWYTAHPVSPEFSFGYKFIF